MAEPLATAANVAGGIVRVRYTHDAMIDLIIAKPGISQNDLAKHFDFTPGWVSRVVNSDSFQARLAERKGELIDPTIVATFEDKLKTAADISLQRLVRKMELSPDMAAGQLELDVLAISTKAMGMGARDPRGGNTNIQFVVALPEKAENQENWVAAHTKVVPNGQ